MSQWTVVVPTCRTEQYAEFVKAWRPLFLKHDVTLIPVYDYEGHYDELPEFIPRKTDMIRSWGFFKAWREGSCYTLTLDDDVRPADNDVFAEYERVFESGAPFSRYLDVGALTSSGLQMRGFPYGDRARSEVVLQYGGWHGTLDYDAPTQYAFPKGAERFEGVVLPVPAGVPVTGCIMNCAFRTAYTPIMWQLPMFDGLYNRFGDIWSGLFAKKTLDQQGRVVVVNGRASVAHERASNPQTNLERETPGIPVNEGLWGSLWSERGGLEYSYRLTTDSAIEHFQKFDMDYARRFNLARDEWLALFV